MAARHSTAKPITYDGPPCPCGCGEPLRRFANGKLAQFRTAKCRKGYARPTKCPACGVSTTATPGRKGYCKACSTSRAGKANIAKNGEELFGRIRKNAEKKRIAYQKSLIGGYEPGSLSKIKIVDCAWCKTPLPTRLAGASKYCSKECIIRHKTALRTHVDKPIECPNCGVIFNRIYNPNYGPHLLSCSDECKQANDLESKRKHKRIRKSYLRAAIASAGPHGKFDPIDILERDGWRCMACGIDTPKELRGTCEPNAPELDHIDPISRGGRHIPSNCQCLCRKCNGDKSDQHMDSFMFVRKFRLGALGFSVYNHKLTGVPP